MLPVTSLDLQIGENLARLRGPRMSQRALADAMTEAGWKWSHVTVGTIERGERPLRVSEAIGAASILDVSVDDLINVHDAAELRKAQSAVLIALDRLQGAVSAWDGARLELAVVADTVGYEPPASEIPGVQMIDVMPLISMTAREVVSGISERRWWDDAASGYLESKGDGTWVRKFVEAEEREHGEHPPEA